MFPQVPGAPVFHPSPPFPIAKANPALPGGEANPRSRLQHLVSPCFTTSNPSAHPVGFTFKLGPEAGRLPTSCTNGPGMRHRSLASLNMLCRINPHCSSSTGFRRTLSNIKSKSAKSSVQSSQITSHLPRNVTQLSVPWPRRPCITSTL